ncbi:ABC transporter ATP-binding protein [Butyrivibrio fibrisolvens]|uniref:ABC transporter ATP-binding protein n=1 Tax=Butyrivibrio fibrisolvens TaxID=831 RepID=A0A317G2E5_BUTFI|nr:ABC transporter ATP-binding protein [Butyrivibrio fibrisolvens]PWT27321.1 hypothetical protein CPT75_09530 [Butyrivibrio fibrisolvens]
MYITKDIIWLGKRYKLQIPRIVALSILMSLMSVMSMIMMAKLINEMLTGKNVDNIVLISCVIVAVYMLIFFMRDIENRMIHSGSVNLKEQIRSDIMKHLFDAGPLVYSEERTGSLSNMIWMKVDWLEYYFDEYLPQSIGIFVFQTCIAAILTYQLGVIGIAYFVCIAIVLFAPVMFNRKAMKLGEDEWQAVSEYSSDSLDRINGMYTLKILNQAANQRRFMEKSTQNLFSKTMKNLAFTTFENNFMSFFIMIAKCMAVITAVMGRSYLGQSKMLLIIFVVIAATDDAYKILAAWIKGAKGISGVTEIIDFMKECDEKKHLKDCNNSKSVSGLDAVSFNDVDFSYGKEKILKDINLQLKCGKNIAIVGASGSGKSTLAYLLCGLYDPQKGTIQKIYNGIEKAFNDREKEVAAIWQDSRLFMGSVFENIKMGCIDCTEADVIAAAKKANIHEKIMGLKDGYKTIVGDGGETFSGGEKQRILIARALLRNTPVVIFDEATAYLDRDNEARIMESIQKTMKDKAVVTIAHRLETVEHSDYVYYLKDGSIYAKGTHDDLMNNCREYRSHFGMEIA